MKKLKTYIYEKIIEIINTEFYLENLVYLLVTIGVFILAFMKTE